MNPTEPLLIITDEGRAWPTENAIRVKLTQVRDSMKEQGITDYKKFGIKAKTIDWTDLDGRKFQGLCLSRIVELRHVFSMIGGFSSLPIPETPTPIPTLVMKGRKNGYRPR